MSVEETYLIDGAVGVLEVLVGLPGGIQPRGIAVCAHPHPLFGGTNRNKVIATVARALVDLGYVTVRPNFRGVGESQGCYDAGEGEQEDMLLSLAWARQRWPELSSLVLAGFSFGAHVQSHVAVRLAQQGQRVQRLVLVGTAVTNFSPAPVAENTLLIHGEQDDIVPLSALLAWAGAQSQSVVVVPGASHFFHRRLHILRQVVAAAGLGVGDVS